MHVGLLVAARPVASSATPEVTSSGRSEPFSAVPSASMARRSLSQFALNFEKSWIEGGVDHAVRRGRAAAQAVQILHVAAMDVRARGGERTRPPVSERARPST